MSIDRVATAAQATLFLIPIQSAVRALAWTQQQIASGQIADLDA
jgi:hypothetical protein